MTGRKSTWGAFLDSSLDRIGDGAVFGGIICVRRGVTHAVAGIGLGALVFGQVTSYVKAAVKRSG